jgi:hypothetical protein
MFQKAAFLNTVCLLSVLSCASLAHAVSVYDEDVNGDISGDYANPTQFIATPGVNTLYATTGSFTTNDLEYLRFDIPAGHKLSKILMQQFVGNDGIGFIGLQSGTAFTFPASAAYDNIDNMLGWSHFGPDNGNLIGEDLLPLVAANTLKFTPPLTGSSYTFWIQQTGADMFYQLDFVVAPIPEPATWSMAAFASLIFLRRRRRQSTSMTNT